MQSAMQMQTTMCLNMIVKNEAHIIRGTLEMLASKIRFDYWVICDTGSTDDTREIIVQFFKEKNIPGELHCDEWVDFGHNRTLALERAFNKTDFLLVFDADDELHGTVRIPANVEFDEYHLKFGQPNSGMNYTRTQLINNRKRFKYFSVLHEFISCQDPTPARVCILDGDYYLISGRTGARNRDPDKYLKDATILASAHADALAKGDDLYKRYAFYCANSYRDCGKYADAIKWYEITLSQDNWVQEKYLACLYAFQCYDALKQKETGFFYLVKAFAYDKERVECLYPLLVHYCCEEMHEMAYNYYRMVKMTTITNNAGKLFVETDKAGFFVPYYMIIVADRVGDRECGVRMYEKIFTEKHRTFSVWHLRNLIFNLRFFINHVKPEALNAFATLANDYLKFVIDNGVPANTFDDLTAPLNTRTVNQTRVVKEKTLSKHAFKHSRNILFYTGFCNAEWNYSEMKVGALGGSEKAVAHLSKELGQLFKAENGYTVYVAGHVRAEELAECNVKYVGLKDLPDLLSKTEFHTVICSRYISFLEIYGNACSFYQFYIWAHDTRLLPYGCDLSDAAIIEKWADCIDGCVCQTPWHAGQYAAFYPALASKLCIINNGIDLTLFPAPQAKQPGKFMYTSRTERGLARILELWPEVVAAVPGATLAVSTYEVFPCNDEERHIQARIAQLNESLNPENRIQHLGKLNPAQLYAEMSTAEYWLYPTNWPETSCITAMEMLMSGVLCLYYPVAGLTDTMNGCGIQVAPGTEVETLRKLAHNDQGKEALRQQGRAYAERCGWSTRAQQWGSLCSPCNCSSEELSTLQTLKKTSTIEYEFGIVNPSAPRRKKIVDFLKSHDFSINVIEGWECDSELAKCKLMLNVHDGVNNDVERNRYHKYIEAGFSILCETSCNVCSNFTQKYPNVRFIDYDDFFDIGTIIDCYNNPFVGKAHNAYVLDILNVCHRTIDIPVAHVSFLEKLGSDFNPPEKMVIYDIGSSVLHWSNHAKRIWKHSDIYAFDAMTEMKLFYDTHNETKNAALTFQYNVGVLCDADYKRISFYQNDELPGGNSYYKEIGHHNSHNIFTEKHIKYKIGLKLETVINNKKFPLPDLIKIDVQGAELDILKGSMNIINSAKFLIVELQHVEYNKGAPLCNRTRDFLIENGWEVYAEKFCNNGPDADWCFINTHKNRNSFHTLHPTPDKCHCNPNE